MTTGLNEKDWELLSAYIDGRLSSFEIKLLEQRLQTDPELSFAYKSLIRTRVILKEVRRVKRRRNFYLTNEMVRPKAWIRLIPVLNFGSAAAAVLAIILFIVDISPSAIQLNKPIVLSEGAPRVQESAPRPAALPEAAENISGGISVIAGSPTPLPTAKLMANGGSAEAESTSVASSVEAPQMPGSSVQPELGPADLAAPSIKAAPSEPLSQAAVPPAFPTPAVEVLLTPENMSKAAAQPNNLQIVPEVIPTSGTVGEQTGVATAEVAGSSIPNPTATQQLIANKDQNLENVPVQDQSVATITTENQPAKQIPTVVSIQDNASAPTKPIFLVETFIKIGWISLLVISGCLAITSLFIKKKSIQ